MKFVYNKLVRDGIPEMIKQEGFTPVTKILSNGEYRIELEKKLHEEYLEVINADNSDDRCNELADMLEVIISLADLEGKQLDSIIAAAKEKKSLRGGFDKRIYLIEKY